MSEAKGTLGPARHNDPVAEGDEPDSNLLNDETPHTNLNDFTMQST